VIRGKYTILDMGDLTPEVIIAISSLVIVAVMLHYHVKGAFCIGLIIGTFVWWVVSGDW
jgi:xanthine/uracil/vitamin C permease (AzgA family)